MRKPDIFLWRMPNGWIIKGGDTGTQVFEDDDEVFGEVESFARALRAVADAVGMSGSKHDAKRLHIEVVGESDR